MNLEIYSRFNCKDGWLVSVIDCQNFLGLPSCSLKFSVIKSAFAFLIARFVTFLSRLAFVQSVSLLDLLAFFSALTLS